MLEELGVRCGLIPVGVAPPFFGLRVPTLVDDDVSLIGSSAICVYLADRFAERGLAPRPGAGDRPHYLRWLYYAAFALEPALVDVSLANDQPDRAALGRATGSFAQCLQVLGPAVGSRRYLMGDHFTAADVIVGSALWRASALGLVDNGSTAGSSVAGYLYRLTERPACKRAKAD
jgi:glutathione S-transferase